MSVERKLNGASRWHSMKRGTMPSSRTLRIPGWKRST